MTPDADVHCKCGKFSLRGGTEYRTTYGTRHTETYCDKDVFNASSKFNAAFFTARCNLSEALCELGTNYNTWTMGLQGPWAR